MLTFQSVEGDAEQYGVGVEAVGHAAGWFLSLADTKLVVADIFFLG